jgi:type I restriction enzyme S subunit
MSWELKSFEELGFIGRGKSRHRPRNDERLYNGIYPLIQTSEIQASNLYINSFTKTYNEFGLSQSKLWKEGTLCLSIVGANTAETAILGFDACFPDSVIGFNAFENVSNNLFVKYFFDFIKVELKSISEGTARENLSLEKLLSKKREVPNFNTQKRIASILSNYDDLIENNLKRIKLLEETAQNIYKEWFVNFRFPNYEHTDFDAESGLPVGWNKIKVTDFFEFIKGIEVGSANYESVRNSETLPFLRVGDISKRDGGIYVKKYLVKDKLVDKNDILISFDGSIGSVGYGLEGSYSSGLRKIISKSEHFGKGFMYCLVKSDNIQNTIHAHAKGTTILHAGTSIIHLEFLLATDNIILSFNQITNPIFEQLVSLNYQNQKLKEARDILLPRLMNRTIEV